MATSAAKIPTRVLQDQRNFRLEENRAWVFRVVENGQPVGVRLDVAFGPFARPPRKFFTNDDGQTFVRAVFDQEDGCLKIDLNEPETKSDTLKTLQQVFKVWHGASGH